MNEQNGVYEVEYYWQDGCGNWSRRIVRLTADSKEHAMELAFSTPGGMPYGATVGVEFCG